MAITLQDNKTGTTGSPPPSVTFNTACSIGDVLICAVQGVSGTSPAPVTVSDNVNTGNYTLLNSYFDSASGSYLAILYKIANVSSGTSPTVSITETSNQFGQIEIARFNGFTGTPTPDATLNASGPFTGTTASVSCSPITSNFNKELLLTANYRASGSYSSPTISGWTATDGATFGSPVYYAVEASSGTTNNFVGTLGTAGDWQSVFAGIYDATGVAGTATIAWIT